MALPSFARLSSPTSGGAASREVEGQGRDGPLPQIAESLSNQPTFEVNVQIHGPNNSARAYIKRKGQSGQSGPLTRYYDADSFLDFSLLEERLDANPFSIRFVLASGAALPDEIAAAKSIVNNNIKRLQESMDNLVGEVYAGMDEPDGPVMPSSDDGLVVEPATLIPKPGLHGINFGLRAFSLTDRIRPTQIKPGWFERQFMEALAIRVRDFLSEDGDLSKRREDMGPGLLWSIIKQMPGGIMNVYDWMRRMNSSKEEFRQRVQELAEVRYMRDSSFGSEWFGMPPLPEGELNWYEREEDQRPRLYMMPVSSIHFKMRYNPRFVLRSVSRLFREEVGRG